MLHEVSVLSRRSSRTLSSLALLSFSALLSVSVLAKAEEPERVLLQAARFLDVESGKMVSPARLLVKGEHIEAVNPASVPDGVRILDLGDRTLLPGLMDMHTHLLFSMEGSWLHRGVQETVAEAVLRGVRNARVTLAAGFTTVRDVGARDFGDVALKKAIDRGDIEGPRMVPAGHSLGITGGHCDATGYAPGIQERGPETGIADGVDEVLRAVRYQIKHGAKVIKTCATAGVLSFEGSVGAQQYSREELETMVQEASRHGLKVAAHAHGAEGILAAVKAGVASIEHGSTLNEEIFAEMKKRGTYLVPTTYLADAIDLDALHPHLRAKAESILPVAKESLRAAIQAGVKIAFGTDAAVYPHGLNAREFASLVDRGMTPLEAIRTATLNAADLLGIDDRGDLKAGLLADIIAVPGDPLKDVRALETVDFVMKGGTVHKSDL